MRMPSRDSLSLERCRCIAVLVLLAVVMVVPAIIMTEKSATFDEVTHLPAGYSYLIEHSIRYNPQHPPLIKEICALPLLLLDLRYPERPSENEWTYGRDFLFRQDAQRILFWGRIPNLLLSLGMASLVAMWARHLWGWGGGLLALFLYAFDPTITAHSQLVTTDVGVAFISLLYLWALRSYLRNPTWKSLLLSGCALGLALGAKFSAVALIPISAVILAVAAFRGELAWSGPRFCEDRDGGPTSPSFALEKSGRTESDDRGGRSCCLGHLLFPERSTLLLERHSSSQSGPRRATLFLFDGDPQTGWLEVLPAGCVAAENSDSVAAAGVRFSCHAVQRSPGHTA